MDYCACKNPDPNSDIYLWISKEKKYQWACSVCKKMSTSSTYAKSILEKATELVSGDRQNTHGDKVTNHQNIARMWNAHLHNANILPEDKHLTPQDVALMMAGLKLARAAHGALNMDDYVDLAGYAACAGEIAQRTHVTLTDESNDQI